MTTDCGALEVLERPTVLPGTVPGPLAVTEYVPTKVQAVQASVVVGCAVGVAQRFYRPFALWLAAQGFRVWTFDYQGQGLSLQGRLADVHADLWTWAQNYDTVIAHARARQPAQPLLLIGHSMGAQLPGLLCSPEPVNGLLSIAAGSGYWRSNAVPLRHYVLGLWQGVLPALTALYGYFPGGCLGMVGDLPAGVAWQWRRWALHSQYSVGAEGERAAQRYAAVRFPIHAWSFPDDEMMTLEGTRSLLALYPHAPSTLEVLQPHALGLRRVGHFGFFRVGVGDALWPRVLPVLQQWCGPVHAADPAVAQVQPTPAEMP